jgi:hypothetical protein
VRIDVRCSACQSASGQALLPTRTMRGKVARLKELKTARPKTKVKKVKTHGKKSKAAKAAAKKA